MGTDVSALTKEQAIAMYNLSWWVDMDAREVAKFQLHEPLLCMPLSAFQSAVETALGRPVWTHEFAYPEQLRDELMKGSPPPTLEEIIGLLPERVRVVLFVESRLP